MDMLFVSFWMNIQNLTLWIRFWTKKVTLGARRTILVLVMGNGWWGFNCDYTSNSCEFRLRLELSMAKRGIVVAYNKVMQCKFELQYNIVG